MANSNSFLEGLTLNEADMQALYKEYVDLEQMREETVRKFMSEKSWEEQRKYYDEYQQVLLEIDDLLHATDLTLGREPSYYGSAPPPGYQMDPTTGLMGNDSMALQEAHEVHANFQEEQNQVQPSIPSAFDDISAIHPVESVSNVASSFQQPETQGGDFWRDAEHQDTGYVDRDPNAHAYLQEFFGAKEAEKEEIGAGIQDPDSEYIAYGDDHGRTEMLYQEFQQNQRPQASPYVSALMDDGAGPSNSSYMVSEPSIPPPNDPYVSALMDADGRPSYIASEHSLDPSSINGYNPDALDPTSFPLSDEKKKTMAELEDVWGKHHAKAERQWDQFMDNFRPTLPSQDHVNAAAVGALGMGAAYMAYKYLGGKKHVKKAMRSAKRLWSKLRGGDTEGVRPDPASLVAAGEAGVRAGEVTLGHTDPAGASGDGALGTQETSKPENNLPRLEGNPLPGVAERGHHEKRMQVIQQEMLPEALAAASDLMIDGACDESMMGSTPNHMLPPNAAGYEDDLKLIAAYDSRRGRMSSLWERKRNKDGRLSERSKYWKHRCKDNSWSRITRPKRIQYMARGRRGFRPRMKKHWGKTMKGMGGVWANKVFKRQVGREHARQRKDMVLGHIGQRVLTTLKK